MFISIPEVIEKHGSFFRNNQPIFDVEIEKAVRMTLGSLKCMRCGKDCEDRIIKPELIPKTPEANELFETLVTLNHENADFQTLIDALAKYVDENTQQGYFTQSTQNFNLNS